MNVLLLSGGSGKRLWPLSNDYCSKQYMKIMDMDSGEKCSMLQRVFQQLDEVGLGNDSVIIASEAQIEIIESQLGKEKTEIAVEPGRRDTFPAILLGCAYLKSRKGASDMDYVTVMPVDPYTGDEFFETFYELEAELGKNQSDIGLIGAVPTYPSEKYGYIVPVQKQEESEESRTRRVHSFREKPTKEEAENMIKAGALWNCGVFCFRIGFIKSYSEKYGIEFDYDIIRGNYDKLPQISFDYEVLEQAKNIMVLPYDKMWKDIGTWNTLAEEMAENSIGQVIWDDASENSHAVNVLDIPMVVMGAKNMVIAASHDGILVADKGESSYIKKYLDKMDIVPNYEERRWGTIKTIDRETTDGKMVITNKVKIRSKMYTTYHCHRFHEEIITILSGNGEMIKDGERIKLVMGVSVSLEAGCLHAVRAEDELRYIEVLVGDLLQDDVEREVYEWEDILRMQ